MTIESGAHEQYTEYSGTSPLDRLHWECGNLIELAVTPYGRSHDARWTDSSGSMCRLESTNVLNAESEKVPGYVEYRLYRKLSEAGVENKFVIRTVDNTIRGCDTRGNTTFAYDKKQTGIIAAIFMDHIKDYPKKYAINGEREQWNIESNDAAFQQIIAENNETFIKISLKNIGKKALSDNLTVSPDKVRETFPHWNDETVNRYLGQTPDGQTDF